MLLLLRPLIAAPSVVPAGDERVHRALGRGMVRDRGDATEQYNSNMNSALGEAVNDNKKLRTEMKARLPDFDLVAEVLLGMAGLECKVLTTTEET